MELTPINEDGSTILKEIQASDGSVKAWKDIITKHFNGLKSDTQVPATCKGALSAIYVSMMTVAIILDIVMIGVILGFLWIVICKICNTVSSADKTIKVVKSKKKMALDALKKTTDKEKKKRINAFIEGLDKGISILEKKRDELKKQAVGESAVYGRIKKIGNTTHNPLRKVVNSISRKAKSLKRPIKNI